jgi:hypothetical protein
MEIEAAMLDTDEKAKIQPVLRELRTKYLAAKKEFKVAHKSFVHEKTIKEKDAE